MDWLVRVTILISNQGSRVECVSLDQEDAMTRSSKLSIGSRRTGPYKIRSKIGRLLHAHYSSILEEPVPDELRSLVVQLSAIEARKHHSTERGTEVLQLAAVPIGPSSN
jgi:anti-sigma factor NepR-like protein